MMLLDLAIKATVLLIVGFACGLVLHRASAASRHTVWTTVFVALLLLPMARLVMPEWAVIAVPDRLMRLGASPSIDAATGVAEGGVTEAVTAEPVQAPGFWPNAWRTGAVWAVVWAIGATGHLLWMAAGLLGVRRLERQARLVEDARVRDRAERASQWLGVQGPVQLLSVSNDAMPVTWGVIKPRVLLPAMAREWSDARLDGVLTHELSHVLRRDAASQLAARLAIALWWWHPLVWVAARRARLERERACDDLVLAQGTCASEYAADLVTFVTSLRLPAVESPATLAMARRSQLEGRVMAILKSDVNRRGVSRTGVLAALLVMVLVWPLAAARPSAREQEPPQAPLRIGGSVAPPTKIKDVRPVYPESAKAAGIQGIVIVEALIDTDGTVASAKVIRAVSDDIDLAAIDAVEQWAFTPTLLNGRPTQVIMTVTVNFTLSDGTQIRPRLHRPRHHPRHPRHPRRPRRPRRPRPRRPGRPAREPCALAARSSRRSRSRTSGRPILRTLRKRASPASSFLKP